MKRGKQAIRETDARKYGFLEVPLSLSWQSNAKTSMFHVKHSEHKTEF